MTRIIHFDLDGVLADFRKAFVAITGQPPEAFSTDDMWSRVATSPQFFLHLDVTAEGNALLDIAKSLGEIRILTAVPRKATYPSAEIEKRKWVARHLGEIHMVVVQYARQKAEYARPGDVLIDDSPDNIRRWVRAGGTGILHIGFTNTVEVLYGLPR
jgi:5'(3')-deoxyribonucleotidase